HFLNRVALATWAPAPVAADSPETPWTVTHRQRVHQEWWDGAPFLPSAHFRGLRLRPLDSEQDVPVQIEGISRGHVLRPLVSGPASERATTRVQAAFQASLPPMGYQVYAVSPTANPNRTVTIAGAGLEMENEYLYVKIAPNGTF